jgi:hypothetical protein
MIAMMAMIAMMMISMSLMMTRAVGIAMQGNRKKQKETVPSLKEAIFIPNESKHDFWGV